jgi:hypothetical protein
MEMIELQNKFAAMVAGRMKSAWDEIRIHYENAPVAGVPREVFTATFLLNGTKQQLKLPLEAIDLLVELKQNKPQGQSEEWVWLEFFMDKTGKYKFDYKYDNPPLIMEQLKYSK